MNSWLPNLGVYALQVTLLLGVALPLPHLLRIRDPKLRLRYWQGLLILILLIPALQPWQQNPTPISAALNLEMDANAGNGSSSSLPISPLLALALAGTLGRLLWLGLGFSTLSRWRRAAVVAEYLPSELVSLRRRLAPRAEVLLSHHTESPLTFGWIRPVVLLPKNFLALPLGLQRGIVCHELLHARRGDWANTMGEEILRSIFWFHPAVWILLDRISLSREQLIDREVVRITEEPRSYLRALLQIARKPPEKAPATSFLRRSHLFHRIALITQDSQSSRRRRPAKVAALVITLLLTSIAGAAAFSFLVIPSPETTLFLQNPAPMAEESKPSSQPLVVAGAIQKPILISRVSPKYTESARKDNVAGSVVIRLVIDTNGRVTDSLILQSVRKDLDDEALDAVRQWRFEPATHLGEPVSVYYNVTVNFKLQ